MSKRWVAWPRGTRRLVGIAAVVLGLAIVWALFVPVADWLAHHDVGSAMGPLHETALANIRGQLLTVGAGLVAAAAVVFTALNFSLLRRNSEQADQWQRRTHELTEQGQVTDRYTKAIEQLGSDKLDVRIGGIYALERIAHDSARDHPTVMEVLTAFIREHSAKPWPPANDADVRAEQPMPADVIAAITVIDRRDAKRDIRPIDLINTDLIGARLDGADLSSARLRGADLIWAFLRGTDLRGADLAAADLRRAYLTGADLTGAHLYGADLRGADLTGADLTGADLTDAQLAAAKLTNAKWPEGAPVPEGWELDTGSGRLRRAGTGAEPGEAL